MIGKRKSCFCHSRALVEREEADYKEGDGFPVCEDSGLIIEGGRMDEERLARMREMLAKIGDHL